MIKAIIHLFFGCRHKRITRPITPVNKARQSGETYVACLDCGRQFTYDVGRMRMGAEIARTAATGSDPRFQHTSA
jgi:hypothetical protein